MTKTISARQLSLLGFVSTFALKLTILPSLLYGEIGVDALLLVCFSLAFDFIEFFVIYYLLKRNENISFATFLEKTFGKVFGKVILLCFFAYFFFKFLILAIAGFDYARFAIFKNAPLFLFLFIILAISSSLVLFKSKAIGRTAEFFYPIIAFFFILFFFVAILTASLQDLRPLLTSGAGAFFSTYFKFLVVGGNYIFMLFFMGKIKFGEKPLKTLVPHLLFGVGVVIIFFCLYYSIFRFTAVAHRNAISELIQFVPLPSILGDFNWFAVSLMLLLFCLQGGIYMFCGCYSLTKIMSFRKQEKDWLVELSVFLFNALVVGIVYGFFTSFQKLKLVVVDSLYVPILSAVIMAMPFLFFIIELAKKEEKTPKKLKLGKYVLKEANYEKDF